MDDERAYQARQKELFADAERIDWSLRNTFHDFLDSYEGGLDSIFNGQFPDDILAKMGYTTDVRMSENGMAILGEAAANEVDGWTTDRRKYEAVMEELCSELDTGDPIRLLRLLHKAMYAREFSRLHRYEDILARLSPEDRYKLDVVFFEPRRRKGKDYGDGLPINADHVFDTLATEFPERTLRYIKGECESYQRDKGKRYEKYFEMHSRECFSDDSGEHTVCVASSSSGYKLVD